MAHGERLISIKVLIIDDELPTQTAAGRAVRALVQELRDGEVIVIEATSADDGRSVVRSDPSLEAILLDWTLSDDDIAHDKAKALLQLIRSRNTHVPIFLLLRRNDEASSQRGCAARGGRVGVDVGRHDLFHCRSHHGSHRTLPRSHGSSNVKGADCVCEKV